MDKRAFLLSLSFHAQMLKCFRSSSIFGKAARQFFSCFPLFFVVTSLLVEDESGDPVECHKKALFSSPLISDKGGKIVNATICQGIFKPPLLKL